MAFQFDPNQTPIDGAAAVVQLVTVLVAAGWAVHAYGDGATRTGSGTGFDATKLRDIAGAWVAVTEPGSSATLVFQRSAAGAGDNSAWWFAYAHDGLNTDGDGTTVDTEATAGDLKDVWGTIGDTHGSGAAALFPADDALGMARCSVAANDAAPLNWYLVCWNKGTGEARTLLFGDVTTGHASDTDTRVIHASYRSGGPWAGNADLLTAYGTAPWSWFKRGLTGETWERCYPMSLYSNNGGRVVPAMMSLNPFDGNDDLFSTVVMHDRASVRYLKGAASMLAYTGSGRPTGHTFDPTGAGDDRVCVEHLALPWPAGVAAVV